MAGDDVTITIRADSGDAVRAFRDVNGQLRDMRGRFVSEGSTMSTSMNRLAGAIGGVKGSLIPLATAAVPLAAALTPVAVKAGAASLAVAAFGAAVAGQAGAMSDATAAQEKYSDAVTQYGHGSKQAAAAAQAMQAQLASMPLATQSAAVQLQTLKGTFSDWSTEMASFTMAPVEKSLVLFDKLVPKLTPMVKGAGEQFERLTDVAGGAMATPGFDALTEKVSAFANESLQGAVDGIIHFTRALSEGDAGDGALKAFMEYAEQNGPALRETLSTVGDAVSTLVEAAADAGPGMLTLVNAVAKLVTALPPELVTILMQTAVALKAVSLAGAGAAAIAGGVTKLKDAVLALGATSAAAGGGMAGLVAAFGSLSRAAKASVVVAGIGLIAVAIDKLTSAGEKAPPNVDRLTTSLGQLGRTGKATGEVAKAFGEDFGKLNDLIGKVVDPSVVESVNNWGAKWSGGLLDGGEATEEFNKKVDATDEALTNLVRNGNAELAGAALKQVLAGLDPEQAAKFRSELDGYDSALADLAFEQDATADSMGVFGQAAMDTQAKLAAQKQSADGLRQSILALNDANRSAYDSQIGYEQALDDLTASFKEHGKTLDIDTEAGRRNGEAMSKAAAAQDEMIATGLAAGESLGSMTQKSEELRETMMRLATDAFDGNKQKATEYVNTLLGVPGEITTMVKAEKEEAVRGLEEVRAAVQATPDAHEVHVSTLNGAAIAALEAVGLKTKRLPDGRTAVFTANGQALGNIGAVSSALNRLDGQTAHTTVTNTTINEIITKSKTYRSVHDIVGKANGGLVPRYADGGDVQLAPNGLLRGPGTGTSDDILAFFASGAVGAVSNTEFVVNAKSTQKYLPLLEAINRDRFPRFAKGGKVSKETEARNQARGDLTLSHFGWMAGWRTSEFGNALGNPDSISSLVAALNQWRSIIQKATSGKTESRLLKQLDSTGKKLMTYERQLDKASSSLQKSKDRLDDLRQAAEQLRSSIMNGVLSAANITKNRQDGPVTLQSIMSGLVGSRDKSVAFASALKQLEAKNVDSAIIQQIAEAGIEGGGLETAGALLKASHKDIAMMNLMQKQILQQSVLAGQVTSDSVYSSQIKGQEQLVKAWERTVDILGDRMEKLTKAMEKAIEKGFGMKASGGIIGAASGGIRSNRTWVGEHGPELLDLPAGARVWSAPDSRRMVRDHWASMLNTRSRGGTGPVVGGGTVVQPVVVHQTITLDGRVVAQQIFDPLRKEIANRGGSVQRTLGQGAG
ncbi:phage tail protein [Streptomyces sp. NPDC058762]|uniref:phage tail protein n=1 Tax=Streptomyces sp. NPDC058762 TaxID=3346629 RepID=UPI0036A11D0B